MVRERNHICGPIAEAPGRLKIGEPHAGSIHTDDAQLQFCGQLFIAEHLPLETGTGRAVKVEERFAIGRPVFVIAEHASIGKGEVLVDSRH